MAMASPVAANMLICAKRQRAKGRKGRPKGRATRAAALYLPNVAL